MKLNQIPMLLASMMGTILEFYDFTLYAVFTPILARTYFPTTDPTLNQILGYSGFAAAFLMRPFGGTIFGYIGDRFGRRIALILSIGCMGVPTCLMGLIPSYGDWGIWASILVLTCRLFQGLCTGGEYNGSAIFALEHVGKAHPGFVGGLVTAASIVGALLATGIGLWMTQGMAAGTLSSEVWRYAFVGGAIVSIAGFVLRLRLQESPEFEKNRKKHAIIRTPIFSAIRYNWDSALTTISVGTLNGLLSYTLMKFLHTYLGSYLGFASDETLRLSAAGLVVFTFAAPFMGFVLDKVGAKVLLLASTLLVFLSALPLYGFLQSLSPVGTVTACLWLGFLCGSIAGPAHAFVQTLFPVASRYSGISFCYSTGMALGGGVGPFLLEMSVDSFETLFAPAFILMGVSAVVAIAIYWRTRRGPAHE